MNEAGDQAENRAARYREPELLADIVRVRLLAFPVAGAERLRQLGTRPRIPAFVDPVQYPCLLRGIGGRSC